MKLTKEKRINFTKIKFILSIGHIFNIWVLSQFIVYLINFQNIYIYTSTYERTLLHTLLLLVFKIVESLQCIPTQFLGSILWGIIPFTWKGNNTILNILIPCVATNSMIKQNMCDIKILWLIGL